MSIWKGKRVFITGHTGFKGAWLGYWLACHHGATVTGYALAPEEGSSLFELLGLERNLNDIRGDVRDLETLTQTIQNSKAEIIIHMAAQSLVRPSYDDPVETYATNVMGTVHVLEAARTSSHVRAVIVVTSDKCYENTRNPTPHGEEDAMGGWDPYSSSKGAAELVTAAYRDSFFNPVNYSKHGVAVASVRAGNVIGGGDFARDRLVPDAIRAFLAKQPVIVRYPDAVRPWQHVLDPLAGYLALGEKLLTDGASFAEGWNFGPATTTPEPVRHVLDRLVTLWGDGARWEVDKSVQPHESSYLALDCRKAQTRLGWQARFDLAQSLALTAQWYKAYQHGDDLAAIMRAQVAAYDTGTA